MLAGRSASTAEAWKVRAASSLTVLLPIAASTGASLTEVTTAVVALLITSEATPSFTVIVNDGVASDEPGAIRFSVGTNVYCRIAKVASAAVPLNVYVPLFDPVPAVNPLKELKAPLAASLKLILIESD